MNQKKLLTLIWRRTNPMELGKDVVLLPYYLGQALGYRTEILCGYPDEYAEQVLAEEKEDLKFVRRWITFNSYQRILIYIGYLFRYASRIDLLMCFHWRFETFAVIWLYRLFNKHGKIYVKLDTSTGVEWDLSYRSWAGKILRKWIYKLCLKKVDLLSCETWNAYQHLCVNENFGKLLKPKLVRMPNSFDEFRWKALGIQERTFAQKKNWMITVGRLGTRQKNTEMLLNALAEVDLKNWTFYLIGPIEKSFQVVIDDFFAKYPDKKECVKFLGPLYDKKMLWSYYNYAKVFVCTSRWESSGIVLNEAKHFRNYILSTRVGEAEDLIEKEEKFGMFLHHEDFSGLRNILQQIVNGEKMIDVYQDYDVYQLSYQNQVEVLVKYLQ